MAHIKSSLNGDFLSFSLSFLVFLKQLMFGKQLLIYKVILSSTY
jgi:hypothetical protein